MPLDQHIEGGHGERQPRLKIRPYAVHHFLEVAHDGQHREHGLHQQTVLPRAARTQFEVGRIPGRGMEGGIAQDDHASVDLANQPLKGVIGDIGGGTVPSHTKPYWFNSRQSLPPTIQRWLERPLRPICCGLRPSRMGWIVGMIRARYHSARLPNPPVSTVLAAFTAHGAREKERLWEVSISSTPRYSPWSACAFVDDLCPASRPSP